MARKQQKQVAEICLYGNGTIGAGYIARTADGRLFGDSELKPHHSMTEAVWLASDDLRHAGIKSGTVRIYAAGGQLMADTDIAHIGYYGDLKWQPATMYTIDADQLLASAETV